MKREKKIGRPQIFSDSQVRSWFKMSREQGLTYRQIAEKVGCHWQSLSYRFLKLGLRDKARRLLSDEEDRRCNACKYIFKRDVE